MGTETEAGVKIRRKTAFVFQNYNLFRNKTALQNVTEGLVIARKMPRSQAEKAGKRALDKVGFLAHATERSAISASSCLTTGSLA